MFRFIWLLLFSYHLTDLNRSYLTKLNFPASDPHSHLIVFESNCEEKNTEKEHSQQNKIYQCLSILLIWQTQRNSIIPGYAVRSKSWMWCHTDAHGKFQFSIKFIVILTSVHWHCFHWMLTNSIPFHLNVNRKLPEEKSNRKLQGIFHSRA